jgi:hypothetical protein
MELAPALAHALEHRLDIVCIGDSNQLFESTGFDHGLTRAFSEWRPLFATGITSVGDNAGSGSGIGYESFVFSTGSTLEYTGAPKALDQVIPGSTLLGPHRYGYLAPGREIPPTRLVGMGITAASPLGVTGPLLGVYVYGTFERTPTDTSLAPTFTPFARVDAPPFTTLARGTPVSLASSPRSEIRSATLEIPADAARNGPVAMRWTDPQAPAINGPFIAFYQRIERPDRVAGVAVNTLYGVGGQSGRDMALAFLDAPTAQIKAFFAILRERQAAVPRLPESPAPVRRVIVRINTGLNDRNEQAGSLGVNRVATGNSPEAYADNLQAIIDRLREVWRAAGWPEDELYFVLTPSHPTSPGFDENRLIGYRVAAEAVAQANPRCAAVRLDRLTDASEMIANGWYRSTQDQAHLSVAGYEELARREVAAIRAAAGL